MDTLSTKSYPLDLALLVAKDSSVCSSFRRILAQQERIDHNSVASARQSIRKIEIDADEDRYNESHLEALDRADYCGISEVL